MPDLNDPFKLHIIASTIHYRIYAQDGSMIPMSLPDTPHWRRFVAWVQIHDRYTTHLEPIRA